MTLSPPAVHPVTSRPFDSDGSSSLGVGSNQLLFAGVNKGQVIHQTRVLDAMSTRRRRAKSPAATFSSPPTPSPSRLRLPSPPEPDVSSNILLFLVAFRLVNSLTVRTFFQPDEFFQSLEPAWRIAFGDEQGPWITWEWEHQLRSSLHPLMFAAVYSIADLVARTVGLSPASRANFLVAAPGITQAVIAAVGDYYTWKLARHIYGERSYEGWATLALTVLSPWQWFCSTRTLSNCLETTITIVALYLWPWEWAAKFSRSGMQSVQLTRLRQCLLLAAFAGILRPTNVIIWIVLGGVAFYRSTWTKKQTLAREALFCGSAIFALSAVVDRFFYGFWTFPPLRFLYFNIVQSLAVFYGKNDFHYYVSQGYPLLLTTALPFTLVGLYRTLRHRPSLAGERASILVQLASISLAMPGLLSLITHKEVRFIYPLLPALHILSASPLVEFFLPSFATTDRQYIPRRLTFTFLILVNVVIAIYTTVVHASGVISVLSYLREQHQTHGARASQGRTSALSYGGITAGFLMPCHSTPWRSHLVEPTIHAWALSCEPPIDLSDAEKSNYRDEADQFYDNPGQFLRNNMVGGLQHIPRRPTYSTPPNSQRVPTQLYPPHEWPDYLIFFAQLEPTLKTLLRGSSYGECWRTFNTAWHDDWRRYGDVVVWCPDASEQQAWQSEKQRREGEERERRFDRIVQEFRKEGTRWPWPWEGRKKLTLFGIELPTFSGWIPSGN
ncbi:putative glycosylphosphatidylinositol-alpha 1,2 mannosyltransferase [Aspergillus lucknowensis]|uniref:Mannosyltransferase n=1 Tax=Aspergillus lucknowensis TaxID=176173 RepID=A0ABR4M0R2_9EURO